MADFFRNFPRFGGGAAIWLGDSPGSELVRNELFGSEAPGATASGSLPLTGSATGTVTAGAANNPTTIMGVGEVDLYFDAALSDLFQNTAGTTPATVDGDPVNFITGLEGPDFVASTSSGRNAILRDPGGDPYLEAVPGSSQLRASISRSGDLYVICRGRWNGTANDQESFWTLTNNASQFYTGNFMVPRYFPFGFNYIQTESSVGDAVTTSAVAITRGVWSTLEIWVDGSTIYTAVNGGTPETYAASGPLGDTTLMDIFGSLDGGVSGSFAVDIRRLAVLNALPDSTERTNLLDWAENGDTGGSSGISGTSSGTLGFTGSSVATTYIAGTASGSVSFTGTSTSTVSLEADAAGTLAFTGTSTSRLDLRATSSGEMPFTGSSTATLGSAASLSASGTIDFTGSSVVELDIEATASGSLAFTGAVIGEVDLTATSSGNISFTGSSEVVVRVSGTSSGTVSFTGTSTSTLLVEGEAVGSIPFSGSSVVSLGVAPQEALAEGSIDFVGTSSARILVEANTEGGLSLTGDSTALVVNTFITASASGTMSFEGESRMTAGYKPVSMRISKNQVPVNIHRFVRTRR